jgi:O-antigen/teichoic acid export membrane protein
LSYGKFITGTSIILYVAGELDNLVIGKVLSMEDLGYYVLAFTLANMVTSFLSRLLSGALFPAYSKIQSDIPAVNRVFSKSLILLLNVVVPTAVGLAILAPELVRLIYGPKWDASIDPMVALCVFGVVRAVMMLIGYLLQAIGKPNLDLVSGAIRLSILGALIYPVAVNYGIEGVAWLVAFAMSMQMATGFWFLKRYIQFRIFSIVVPVSGVLLRNAVMGVAVVLVSRYLDAATNLWGLFAAVAVGVVVYVAISYRPMLALFKGSAESA